MPIDILFKRPADFLQNSLPGGYSLALSGRMLSLIPDFDGNLRFN